jgi:hypothetical protein
MRSGFFLGVGLRFGADLRLDAERDEARDDERRDGEVFVAIGP